MVAEEEETKPDTGSEEGEADSSAEGGAEAEGEEEPPKKGKKKLIIIILVVLLLGGGGAGAYFSGLIGGGGGEGEEGEMSEEDITDPLLIPQTLYFDLDEFLVNLNNPSKQVSFLKMTVTLELPNLKTQQTVEEFMPRIRDSFQVYLRELRSSDLQGSAGIHRLREELLLRINNTIEPDQITDILFKEIIVQ